MNGAGNMRNVVELWMPTTSTDATGQETYSYALYKIVFAAFERDKYSKSEAGLIQDSGNEEISFILRYDRNITYNHRLIFNDITYRITGIDNHKNLNHWHVVKATAVDL